VSGNENLTDNQSDYVSDNLSENYTQYENDNPNVKS